MICVRFASDLRQIKKEKNGSENKIRMAAKWLLETGRF